MTKSLNAAKIIDHISTLSLVFQDGRAEAAANLFAINLAAEAEAAMDAKQGDEDDDDEDYDRKDEGVECDGGEHGFNRGRVKQGMRGKAKGR